VGRSSTINRK